MDQIKQKTGPNLHWNFLTICPMDIPFGLTLGFSHKSQQSIDLLNRMAQLEPSISIDVSESFRQKDHFSGAEYLSLTQDVSTIRLFSWHYEMEGCSVRFHVFPNHIAISEISILGLQAGSVDELDKMSIQKSETYLSEAKIAFNKMLENLVKSLATSIAVFDKNKGSGKIYWPSRAILLDSNELEQKQRHTMLREWLAETIRPEDADLIIEKKLSYSMTWLRYVVVNKASELDNRIETMVLAQYCYTAQEKCNRHLRQAIEWAFQGSDKKLEDELQKAKNAMETSRVMSKLHTVSVNESLRHLTIANRELIDDIFKGWEYERLRENGNIMLDLCSDKINESNSRQAKISAYKTEYILIGISLFTVLDFFFFMTQFSREAMANPILDHNDGGPSSFLTVIADVPADLMFFIGVVIAGLIFLAYRKVKG